MRRDDLFLLAMIAFSQAWLIASHFAAPQLRTRMSFWGAVWVVAALLGTVLS